MDVSDRPPWLVDQHQGSLIGSERCRHQRSRARRDVQLRHGGCRSFAWSLGSMVVTVRNRHKRDDQPDDGRETESGPHPSVARRTNSLHFDHRNVTSSEARIHRNVGFAGLAFHDSGQTGFEIVHERSILSLVRPRRIQGPTEPIRHPNVSAISRSVICSWNRNASAARWLNGNARNASHKGSSSAWSLRTCWYPTRARCLSRRR